MFHSEVVKMVLHHIAVALSDAYCSVFIFVDCLFLVFVYYTSKLSSSHIHALVEFSKEECTDMPWQCMIGISSQIRKNVGSSKEYPAMLLFK